MASKIPELVKYPNPFLKRVCDSVEEVDDETRELLDSMGRALHFYGGAGLSAPQIGVAKRVIVMSMPNNKFLGMINPEIVTKSAETEVMFEQCLSFGKLKLSIERPAGVTVKFLNHKGVEREMDFTDFAARVLQHEIDHLDGISFYEHVVKHATPMKRDIVRRKLAKLKRIAARESEKVGS